MSRYDEIVDELYGLTPDVFVKRRNEIAKEVKADGETSLAKDISKLRRPTQAAWAINQWVRANPDDCDQVTALAADLSAAQRRSAADTMRELSRRRQELINSSVDGVAGTASSLGVGLSDSAVREVATTLRAAIADAEILADLRHGRLVTSAEYSGFGPAGVFVVPDPPDESKRKDNHDHDAAPENVDTDSADEREDSDEDAEVRRELEARIARAEYDEQSARESLGDASSAVDEASSEVDELVAEARDLREQLSRVEDSLRFARQRLSTAEEGRSEAKVALRDAVAEANKLRAALADL